MVVDVLMTDLRSTAGVGIVAPTEYTSIGDVGREEISQPVDFVYSPAALTTSVEPMDGYHTKDTRVSQSTISSEK